MVDLFVQQGTGPALEILIVDEAQDLTPLMEASCHTQGEGQRSGTPETMTSASTAGMVDLHSFMNACDNKVILNKAIVCRGKCLVGKRIG